MSIKSLLFTMSFLFVVGSGSSSVDARNDTPPDKHSVGQQQQQRTCYQLTRVTTCADDPTVYGCSADTTYQTQGDGSILFFPNKPRFPEINAKIQVWPAQGKSRVTSTTGSGDGTWTVPPSVWCSDQDFTAAITVAETGECGISEKYWNYPVQTITFEPNPSGNPFGYVNPGGPNQSKSVSQGGVRPVPGLTEPWSLGVQVNGTCNKDKGGDWGGETLITYNYTVLPAGQTPPASTAVPPQSVTPGTGQSGGGGGALPSWGCTTSGITINPIDGDPENQLAWCDNRVPFGDESFDKGRCFTFRYQIPSGGVSSAFLSLSIKPQGDADTDNIIAAVGSAQASCGDAGKMAGCVVLHGGMAGHESPVTVDLMGNGCDQGVKVAEADRTPLSSQLQTGVLHVRSQDDTVIYGAQLILNCAPSCPENQPGGGQPGGGSGTGTSGGASNTTLPMPSFGTGEPYSGAPGMALQAGQRRASSGALVYLPVWLINANNNVANMNFEMSYDPAVAVPEGNILPGNMLDGVLFSPNPIRPGTILFGFASVSNMSGTGTVAYVPFRLVGPAGSRTPLNLKVTIINDSSGSVPAIDRIPGEIVVLGAGEGIIGDCNADGHLTSVDALCALQISVQLRPVMMTLDIDKNGSVTSRDASIILQQALRR